jgi:hypothetical protein
MQNIKQEMQKSIFSLLLLLGTALLLLNGCLDSLEPLPAEIQNEEQVNA